jgi:HK97 family phage portal protein
VGLWTRLTAPWRIAEAQERYEMLLGPNGPVGSYYASPTLTGNRERIGTGFRALAEQGYGGNAIVFALIGRRLALFSEVELAWQNLGTRELFGTPSLRLLEEPWPNADTGELLSRMEQDVSLAGNAFIRNVDGQRLERLRPDLVSIVSEVLLDERRRPYKEALAYFYHESPGSAEGVLFDVDEVAHWSPIPDPWADFRGMSWLTPVVREINADLGMTSYKQSYLDNAATPNMIVRYPEKVGDPVIERVREQMAMKYGGVSNAYKTMVLDAGADLTLVGNSLEQMSFATVQAAGENRIAAASGVPPIVAGLKEGLMNATYSNYEQAMRAFADLWARPQWRSACAALSKIVPAPPGSRLWFDPTHVSALRQGEKERAETQNVMAETMAVLLRVGYTPDTVTTAVKNGDLAQLQHSGNLPVTLYPEGREPSDTPAGSGNDSQSDSEAAA